MNKYFVAAGLAAFAGLVYLLAPMLTPFVAGALVAYLADPLVDRLEALGLKRLSAVLLVFGLLILIVGLMLLLVVPLLEDQIASFIDELPAYARWFQTAVVPWLQKHLGVRLRLVNLDQLTGMLSAHWQQAGGIATTALSYLTHSGAVVVSWLINLLLIPVVVFYLLRDWDVMIGLIRDLLPLRWRTSVVELAKESDEVLSSVFRGQFMVMAALGTIYSLGLWLVGVNLGLLIGMFAGLVSFIPYAGATTGIVLASVVALAQFGEFGPVLWVWAVFGVGQTLEGMWLTPTLVGNRIGLHPVAVIFAVLAGGQLFGFLGVLLALPLASVVMVLLRHAHELYKESDLYSDTKVEVYSTVEREDK
ncbi:AI-2E family transporter [Methylomagnum sp.]